MTAACPAMPSGIGLVRNVLGSVDCNVRAFSQAGYEALTGPQGMFSMALTSMLTIYVAVLGYRMMFGVGGARISDAPLIGLKIGAILAVSLSWTTFQTLVFDVGMKAPLEIARIVGGPAARSGAALAADPISGLQVAYDQINLNAAAFGKQAGPSTQALGGGAAQASEGLWKTSSLLFMSTVGVFSLATVTVGVLSAIGPIFIALFLFESTRGLFVGWVRAMVAAALAPVACWVTTEIMLVVIEPWLVTLAGQRQAGLMNPDDARGVIAVVSVFALAQMGLLLAGAVIAGGLELRPARSRSGRDGGATPEPAASQRIDISRAQGLAHRLAPASAEIAASRVTVSAGRSPAGSPQSGREPPPGQPVRLGDGLRRDAYRSRLRGAKGPGS